MTEISPFYFFLIAAVVLFALELGIFQLSVFWFLFAALGASVTAAICWFFPETGWTAAIGYFAAATLAIVTVMFPVLRKLQNQPGGMSGNDAVGQKVRVLRAISAEQAGKVEWSGRDWDAELAANATRPLAVGDSATIEAVAGIRLIVRPL
ncbi:MAG: NfeD family protein [Granulosicoccaceae bacterium]